MKRNILRVFGVLFSILIIASVFLPYGKNGVPLFVLNNTSEIILPVLIMAFGSLSILLYILNTHCEFAISTSGAVLFFVIIEAVYAISNKTLNEFNLGYYALAAGSVLLFFNTILILFTKKKEKEEVNASADTTVTNNTVVNDITPVQSVDLISELNYEKPIEQPVQLEPVEQIIPTPVVQEPISFDEPVVAPIQEPQVQQPISFDEPVVAPIQEPQVQQPEVNVFNTPTQSVETPIQEIEPVSDINYGSVVNNPLPEIQFEQMPEYKEPIKPIYEEPKEVRPEDNPALQSLFEPSQPVSNPVEIKTEPINFDVPQDNPVLQQFDQPMSFISQPVETQNTQQTIDSEEAGMSIFNNH